MALPSFTTLFAFAFVLGAAVVLHEFGHFLVARAVGIYCKTFSVGFGPKLLKKKIGETEWALSAFPLGGYVKMAGEGGMEAVQDSGTGDSQGQVTEDGELDEDGTFIPRDRFFSSKTVLQRLAVVLAGPAMNLLLAFLIYTGLALYPGLSVTPSTTLDEVAEDSSASEAGLLPGDILIAADGEAVRNYDFALRSMSSAMDDGRTVQFTIERDGRQFDAEIDPTRHGLSVSLGNSIGRVRKDGPAWNAGLREGDRVLTIDDVVVTGYSDVAKIVNANAEKELLFRWERPSTGKEMSAVVVPEAALVATSIEEVETLGRIFYWPAQGREKLSPMQAVVHGADRSWFITEQTAKSIGAIVTGKANKEALSGPLGIAKFSGEMARWGFDALLAFLAMLSINLFILNLLPIPVLDGGHVVFLAWEAVVGRPPGQKIQEIAMQVGFVALLLLMGWVITMDVIKEFG